jgi:hypothetical protein
VPYAAWAIAGVCFGAAVLCIGPLFTAASTARSNRSHPLGSSSISSFHFVLLPVIGDSLISGRGSLPRKRRFCCVTIQLAKPQGEDMIWLQILGALANLASIATAIVAVLAYWRYSMSRRNKQKRLEEHLRAERENGRLAIAIVHLVAELGMTESEILDASFRSRHIVRLPAPTLDSAPSSISLEYQGK